jgi:hypothetical protein
VARRSSRAKGTTRWGEKCGNRIDKLERERERERERDGGWDGRGSAKFHLSVHTLQSAALPRYVSPPLHRPPTANPPRDIPLDSSILVHIYNLHNTDEGTLRACTLTRTWRVSLAGFCLFTLSCRLAPAPRRLAHTHIEDARVGRGEVGGCKPNAEGRASEIGMRVGIRWSGVQGGKDRGIGQRLAVAPFNRVRPGLREKVCREGALSLFSFV